MLHRRGVIYLILDGSQKRGTNNDPTLIFDQGVFNIAGLLDEDFNNPVSILAQVMLTLGSSIKKTQRIPPILAFFFGTPFEARMAGQKLMPYPAIKRRLAP